MRLWDEVRLGFPWGRGSEGGCLRSCRPRGPPRCLPGCRTRSSSLKGMEGEAYPLRRRALVGTLFATPPPPPCGRGQAAAREDDTGLVASWVPSRSRALVGSLLWGGDAPRHPCREGREGKGREEGGGCPAAPSAGPRGVFAAVGSAGAGGPAGRAHVPWKIFCPAPASGAPGQGGCGERREP